MRLEHLALRAVRPMPTVLVTRPNERSSMDFRHVAPRSLRRGAADEARAGVEPNVTLLRLQAWAAHEAIVAGVYIFLRHPDDPRAAILEGANTDGDSDSIATLAGALVGARCGIERLPTEWVGLVERGVELRDLASRLST